MYFSTKGWAGFGDNDIFVSRRLDDTWTRWSAPENLGPNINTSGWDGYFCLSAKGDYAYFSSRENSLGQEDIFRLKVPESIKPQTVIQVTGTVLNVADNKPIAAKINVQSLEDSDTICVNYDPQTGEYKLMLPTKRSYSISASKKGFMAVSERMDIEDEKNYREVKKNLYMLPIESGQKMTLNSVYFEQSKFDLLPNSFNELNQIVTTMKENPSMEILLEGHTDNQGDWNANLLLSKQRVEEVQKYLVRQGISKSRIQIQGFGSTRPLASNNSEEKRKLNRRVEFTIVKK
jgi:outer membrane protein OmpA-like peptidoglycan-associated protein